MIHYISPFRCDKNIGLAINHAIEQLHGAAFDWVVHLDQDAMFLRPDSKAQLEHILNNTDYDLLGPLTNRLFQRYQLVPKMFDVYDIREHVKVADLHHTEYYGKVTRTPNILAAFCLCFRVQTWGKLGRFTENSLQFDSSFSTAAHKAKLKVGIMPGIYVFHGYRLHSSNPKEDIRHLLPVK